MTIGPRIWRVSDQRDVVLDRARLMAILNITPDSFSDGGTLTDPARAVATAERAVAEGADILDIGGESTRPGAGAVSASEQIARVVPVIAAIRSAGIDTPISVDTTRAAVAAAALDAGADAVNDVSAGRDDPGMFALVARRGAGIVLMHRVRAPERDSYSDRYSAEPDFGDVGVVEAVRAFLIERAGAAMLAGAPMEGIVIDPGLGFGKSVRQNYALIAGTREIAAAGFPVLAASSRKSFLGAESGAEPPAARDIESVAAAVAQRLAGAAIFRVHDVPGHRRALAIADAAGRAYGSCWSD